MMNESIYLIHSLGFTAHSLQNGISLQIIEDVALKIKQLPQASVNSSLVDLSHKLLPVIEDAKFVCVWVELLERLSSLCQQEEIQAIYRQINERQGSLPKDVLHKLWLSHLPSLEFAVLKLVGNVSSKHHSHSSTMIRDSLMKSFLVEIASNEIVIHETILRMFMSMIVSSDFALIMTEITAVFCHLVRTTTSQFAFQTVIKNSSTLWARAHRLESLISSTPDPECLSSSCTMDTIQNLHRAWKDIEKMVTAKSTGIETSGLAPSNCETSSEKSTVIGTSGLASSNCETSSEKSTGIGTSGLAPSNCETSSEKSTGIGTSGLAPSNCDTSSETTPDQQFEDLYSLTVQYRSWVFAALDNIFSCDKQYVEPCLWFIAAHHRIKLCTQSFQTFETGLYNLVCGLRDLLSTSNQNSELAPKVTSLAEGASLTMESRAPRLTAEEQIYQNMVTSCRSVVSLLLMAFLFQSDAGFTVGSEIVTMATSSKDIADHISCLTYHYHALSVQPKKWSAVKHDQFLLFVCELCAQLENENSVKEVPSFLHLHSDLKSVLLGLK